MAEKLTLYALGDKYLALVEQLEAAALDETTIADTIESTGIVDDFNAKAEALVSVARNFEQFDDAIDAEIARLKALKDSRHKRADGVRAYLKREMIRTNITRIECPRFVIALRNNPESVEIFDTRMIPGAFMRVPPVPEAQPDKAAIKEAIKAGLEVPGARLAVGQRIAIT